MNRDRGPSPLMVIAFMASIGALIYAFREPIIRTAFGPLQSAKAAGDAQAASQVLVRIESQTLGYALYRDRDTGCQYFAFGAKLQPRYNSDGNRVLCTKTDD